MILSEEQKKQLLKIIINNKKFSSGIYFAISSPRGVKTEVYCNKKTRHGPDCTPTVFVGKDKWEARQYLKVAKEFATEIYEHINKMDALLFEDLQNA